MNSPSPGVVQPTFPILLGAMACAVSSISAEPVPEIGRAVLHGYRNTMAEIESFSVRIESSFGTRLNQEGELNTQLEWRIEASEPNYIRAEYTGEFRARQTDGEQEAVSAKSLISDGESSYLLQHTARDDRSYTIMAAPRDFRQVFDREVWARSDDIRYVMSEMGLLPYLHPDTVEVLAQAARYRGLEEGDGRQFHVFQLDYDYEERLFGATYRYLFARFFFDEEEPFLLRRHEIYFETDHDLHSDREKYVTYFRDWRLNPSIARERFRWEPSPEYRQVDRLAPTEEEQRLLRDMLDF